MHINVPNECGQQMDNNISGNGHIKRCIEGFYESISESIRIGMWIVFKLSPNGGRFHWSEVLEKRCMHL